MRISKNIDVYMDLSVDDVVTLIWEMDAREQAELLLKFNKLKDSNYPSVVLQMYCIGDKIKKLGIKDEVHSFIEKLADCLEV